MSKHRIVMAPLSLVSCIPAIAQETSTSAVEALIGAWRGESKCMVRPSSCNDEDALYRFSSAASPGQVRLSANKIVSGKEVNMGGDTDCRYRGESQTIDCSLPNGFSIHFDVKGASMQGKMTKPDGTLWRNISLHKIEEK